MMKNLFKRAQGRACPTFAERRKTGPTAIVRVFATLALMLMAATGAWAQSYNVTVKKGTEDAANWAITPSTAPEGETVTVKYNGSKKVLGVRAVKKPAVSTATPLTMECLTDGTIVVKIYNGELTTGMQYAVNDGTKTKITKTTTIADLKTGDKVQFYGVGTSTQVYGSVKPEVHISGGTAQVKVYGNIMSLLDEDNFATKTDLPNKEYVFGALFADNAKLTDASGLLLPATTLAYDCYSYMFSGCSALTAAPALPATTLADNCYNGMFALCSALTTAPALPVTTLANYCYCSMFFGCSALTTAPVLPATTLVEGCYYNMFYNCSKLASVTCKATNVTAIDCLAAWLENAGTDASVTTRTLYVEPSMIKAYWHLPTGDKAWSVAAVSTTTPLTMECLTDGTIVVNIVDGELTTGMQYAVNGGTKTKITTTTTIEDLKKGDKVQFYGVGTSTQVYGSGPEVRISGGTADVKVYGNIMSLLDENNFATKTDLPSKDYIFCRLFYVNAKLTDASGLLLPATTLAYSCYDQMFYGCSALTAAPALPATTLTEGCYYQMFRGCSALTAAPELPATTLAYGSYQQMFYGCSALTAAPALPAMALAAFCYSQMFYGCSALTAAPALPATTLTECCYFQMFQGCSALTAAPELPATTLIRDCYRNMFYGCSELTAAPELPATTLAMRCYYNMFYNCSKLASVTCKATDISAQNCLAGWLLNAGTDASVTSRTLYVDPTMTGADWQLPTGDKAWSVAAVPTTPLTMECLTNGTIVVEIREVGGGGSGELTTGMQYAVNGGTKTKITKTTTIEGLKTGDKVQFYGVGTDTQTYGSDSEVSISGGTAQVKVYGNIMSLLDEENFATKTDLPNKLYVFYGLFAKNAKLTDASGLLLPATTLADYCYSSMFYACSALTAAPALPATKLADFCYYCMFASCSALTTAPALPATTLDIFCYSSMFDGCSALTTAPALPATTLVDCCYQGMFYECSKLASVTCKATDVNATDCLTDWLEDAGTDASVTTRTLYVEPSMTEADWYLPGDWSTAAISGN